MPSYTVDTVIEAPRKIVFGVFADRERTGQFMPLQSRLVREGTDERQGVGAVHFLGLGPVGVKEELTELLPGRRIAYRLVAGLPVRSHIGTIEFDDDARGTRVIYTMSSRPHLPVPASLLELALRGAITAMVSGARRESARRATEP